MGAPRGSASSPLPSPLTAEAGPAGRALAGRIAASINFTVGGAGSQFWVGGARLCEAAEKMRRAARRWSCPGGRLHRLPRDWPARTS